MSTGPGDFYGDTSGGPPIISWDSPRPGDGFSGVLLPVDVNAPDVSYETEFSTKVGGDPDYWPLKAGETDADLRQKTHAVHYVKTDFKSNEQMSLNAKKRRTEDGVEDDGLRRYFVKGASASKGMTAARKAAGLKSNQPPQVGMYLTVKLVEVRPNAKGKENIFDVSLRPADAASKKVVADYIAAESAKVESDESDYPGTDEPPF